MPSKPTPILLLKTKSTPNDAYEEFFSANNSTTNNDDGNKYTPHFIPVLEHNFNKVNLSTVRSLFETDALAPGPDRRYGGLIFTSQRAVEGFAGVVRDVGVDKTTESSHSLIIYTVGPATSRAVRSLCDTHFPHASILGSDTGNGENLAHFILDHYNNSPDSTNSEGRKLPLLFLVGEQRRDVIPKALMDENRPVEERIGVEEMVVYETGVMQSFEGDFRKAIDDGYRYLADDGEGVIWVVVFSPTGCDAMLRVLGFDGSSTNKSRLDGGDGERPVFVATIGPTTRDHLRGKYGFEADVCAEKPSQEGVGMGIERFMGWRRRERTA